MEWTAGKRAVRETEEIGIQRPLYRVVKRTMDIVGSLLGLILFSPVFLITAILIHLEDGEPIIFAQERTGENGKVFKMYKFRSMRTDAMEMHQDLLPLNEMDGPVFKMKNDPRVTKVGRVIRRTSIDELPQFLNVLKGEMTLVGPRPLPTYEMEQCNEYQKQRLQVKQGLTCYWQCSGRNNISFDEWVELDLKYIREASILVDIKILCKTVVYVISCLGAY